jgi:hypothetical protein
MLFKHIWSCHVNRQSDLAVNVVIVVTERALVVIHNLSNSHLRSEKVSMCYDSQAEIEPNVAMVQSATSFRSKTILRLCQAQAHLGSYTESRAHDGTRKDGHTLWVRVKLSKLSPDLKGYGGCSSPDWASRPATFELPATCTC